MGTWTPNVWTGTCHLKIDCDSTLNTAGVTSFKQTCSTHGETAYVEGMDERIRDTRYCSDELNLAALYKRTSFKTLLKEVNRSYNGASQSTGMWTASNIKDML